MPSLAGKRVEEVDVRTDGARVKPFVDKLIRRSF